MAGTKFQQLPPVAPNGGWGWAVVAASFFSNFIVDGTLYTYGIFFYDLQQTFASSKTTTALGGSLLGGLYLSVGPIASALSNKFGCRTVAMCGSLLSGIAFFISSFSNSIEMLLITYGIVGGIGYGMMYLPSIVMVGNYFDTKRAVATGIAVCGSGLGTFVFAPLADQLLDTYGWRGANIIIAGIALHGMLCGAVYRPLTVPKQPKITAKQTESNNNKLPEVVTSLDTVDQTVLSKAELEKPMLRMDVLYTSSVQNLNEFKESENMQAYVNSVISISHEKDGGTKKKGLCSTMFDCSLFLSPTFMIVCMSGVCGFLGYYTPFMYLADYSMERGMTKKTSSMLLSAIGLSSIVARIVTGLIADRPWADSLVIHNVAAILAGLATCLLSALASPGLLFTYSVFFGATLSAFIALRSIVICDLLGVEKLTNAFGIVALFQGVALLCGTPFSGFIYDSTGAYTYSFIVAGCILAMGGVLCLPARRIARWEASRIESHKKDVEKVPGIEMTYGVKATAAEQTALAQAA